MNRRRMLLAVIAGVPVLLVLIAVVVLPLLVDSDHYRGKLITLVNTQTGRDLHIDGPVRLRLLPAPRVTVSDVRLGNPPGFAGSDLASLSALTVELEIRSLLRGRLVTRGLEVRGLTLKLERDAHGRGNWEDWSGAAQGSDGSEPDTAVALPGAMVVGGLDIRDATIDWRDPATGTVSTIARVDVHTDALRVGEGIDDVRIRATLPGGVSDGAPAILELRGDVALPASGDTLRVPNLAATIADLVVAGVRIDAGLDAQASADLDGRRLTIDPLRLSVNAFDGEDGRITLEADTTLDFDFSRQRLTDSLVSIRVPTYAVSGIGGELRVDGVLAGDLAAGTYTLREVRSRGTAGSEGDADGPRSFRFDADLKLDIERRTLVAKPLQLFVQDLHTSGALALEAGQKEIAGVFDLTVDDQHLDGNFAVSESTAGRTLRLDVSADLDIGDGRYALRGRHDVDLRAGVLRASGDERYRVADLQLNAHLADPASPEARIAVGLLADVDVDLKNQTVRSDNVRLNLDESHIAGSVDVRGFDAPALRFDLHADAIDADRLLPPAGGNGRARTAPVAATIAAIRALDLDGEIRVDKLTLQGLQMSNVRVTSRGGTANR